MRWRRHLLSGREAKIAQAKVLHMKSTGLRRVCAAGAYRRARRVWWLVIQHHLDRRQHRRTVVEPSASRPASLPQLQKIVLQPADLPAGWKGTPPLRTTPTEPPPVTWPYERLGVPKLHQRRQGWTRAFVPTTSTAAMPTFGPTASSYQSQSERGCLHRGGAQPEVFAVCREVAEAAGREPVSRAQIRVRQNHARIGRWPANVVAYRRRHLHDHMRRPAE